MVTALMMLTLGHNAVGRDVNDAPVPDIAADRVLARGMNEGD